MKTEIQEFCADFHNNLKPFSAALKDSVESLRGKNFLDELKEVQAVLTDVEHRLHTLVEKVEGQQAYLLIFGPLKSGKSTLMNAVSGSYVSEVSSLPAYPCLVYVRHSETNRFSITKYNGRKLAFTDEGEMQERIRQDHEELANRILDAERRGEEFEPGIHFPEAIRRVDFELPAPHLKDSGTVLVDTPGLYSRMKFGYDLMTREFRNSAACAVFVVKTDNLFLEQVFAEFGELLGCFSRIFLVVNTDSTKKDLAPDGSLVPSLESEDPQKIVRAFESLSMSAPLREASEEGRLNIYCIDLLQAAATQLRARYNAEQGEFEVTSGEDKAEAALAGREETYPKTGYSEFVQDLTDYLNSNDYLIEFMRDSLRQGTALSAEIQEQTGYDAIQRYKQYQANLEISLNEIRAKLDAVETLEQLDWDRLFTRTREEKDRMIRRQAESCMMKLSRELQEGLEGWYQSDDSLRALQDDYLNRRIEEATGSLYEDTLGKLRGLVENSRGGADISLEVLRAFDRIEFPLEDFFRTRLTHLGGSVTRPSFAIRIDARAIPVRKRFFDWLMLRSQNSIRKAVFGDLEQPDKAVSVKTKQKRLSGVARQHLDTVVDEHPKTRLIEIQTRFAEEVLANHIAAIKEAVSAKLADARKGLYSRQKLAEQRLEESKEVLSALDSLNDAARNLNFSVEEISERYRVSPVRSVEAGEPAGEPEDLSGYSLLSGAKPAEPEAGTEAGETAEASPEPAAGTADEVAAGPEEKQG